MQRCVLFLLLLPSLAAQAARPGPPLAIPYLAEAPMIDGRADDWLGPPTATWQVTTQRPALRNRVRVRFGWDENYFYALYQVADQQLVQLERGPDNPQLYLNDAVELFVDAPGDSRQRMDVNDYQFIVDVTGNFVIFKGDKQAPQEDRLVPKDHGTATLLPRVAVRHQGSINQGSDRDSGYVVELAVPWAGLGVRPRAGHRLALDACVEDMDSVFDLHTYPENRKLRVYSYESWTGISDFGFPQNWRAAQLVGGPDALARVAHAHPRLALRLAGLLAALLGLLLAYHGWRVRQLRQIPVRAALSAAQRLAAGQEELGNLRVTPGSLRVTLEDIQVTLGDIQVTPGSIQVTPGEIQAAPRNFQVAPGNVRVAPGNVRVAPGSSSAAAEVSLPHQALFAQCRDYVLAHLRSDVGPADLADHAAMGVRNLQRFFRDELDLTPAAFITQVRLEEAAAQLRVLPRPPVGEVADAVGFADMSYFGRAFKRYFGVTPREYGRDAGGAA